MAIGEAVINVIANSSSFDRTISNLGKTSARALESGTRSLGARAGDIGERIGTRMGSAVTRNFRRAVIGIGAVLTAVTGVVVARSFNRFADLEDATASLTVVLGSAVEAGKLLEQVLKVVEGTPFSLDQFTTAARNLAAANVETAKIPGILTAIGDAAAASGRGAEGVDDVVAALGRMATGATISLQPIRDLEQLGVPALRILANKAGISAGQMAKNITKGTVDSKKAIDDLVAGIEQGTTGIAGSTAALGGVAQKLGETTRGALANLNIALARAGANILKAFSNAEDGGNVLARILTKIRDAIDIVGKRFEGVAKRIAKSEAFGRFIAFFDSLPDKVNAAFDTVDEKGFGAALSDLFGKIDFAALASKVTDGIASAFDRLPHEKFAALVTNIIVRSIAAVAGGIDRIVAAVVKAAPAIIAGIARGLFQAAKDSPLNVGLLLLTLGLPGIGPIATKLLTGIFGALPFGTITAPLIKGLGKALQAGFGAIFGEGLLASIGSTLLTGVQAAGSAIAAAATSLAGSIVAAILAGVALGIGIHWLLDRLAPGVNRAIEAVGGALFDFFSNLPRVVGGALSRFGGFVVDFFARLPGRIVGALSALVSNLADLGARAIRALATGAESAMSVVFGFFRELPRRIAAAFADPTTFLFNVGKQLVAGLLLGAIWFIRRIKFVGNIIADALQRQINKAFEISSPSRLTWRIGLQIGEGLTLGISQGIQRTSGSVVKSAAELVGSVTTRTPSIGELQTLSRSGGGGFTGSGAVTQNFDLTVNQVTEDPRTTAFKVAAELGKRATR